jgi:hypothetical protein
MFRGQLTAFKMGLSAKRIGGVFKELHSKHRPKTGETLGLAGLPIICPFPAFRSVSLRSFRGISSGFACEQFPERIEHAS